MIVDCGLYVEGARVGGQHDFEHAVKEAKSNPGAFVWVGMHEPSVTEFADLAREFDLHPLAVEDAVHAHQRPKLEVYGDTLFLVLKAARYVDHDEVVELAEIMLFVGRDFVVTVRHGHTATLTPVRRALEADPERLRCGPTAVLHAIVDSVVDHYDVVGADLRADPPVRGDELGHRLRVGQHGVDVRQVDGDLRDAAVGEELLLDGVLREVLLGAEVLVGVLGAGLRVVRSDAHRAPSSSAAGRRPAAARAALRATT